MCSSDLRLEETGSSKRKVGSGRPRSARSAANRDTVGNEILSQEDQPGTHKSQRKLATQMNIGQSSVSRIVKDLGLKSYRRIQVSRKYVENSMIDTSHVMCKKIVFTDEKDFTLEIVKNCQNDRVY